MITLVFRGGGKIKEEKGISEIGGPRPNSTFELEGGRWPKTRKGRISQGGTYWKAQGTDTEGGQGIKRRICIIAKGGNSPGRKWEARQELKTGPNRRAG